MSLYLYVCLLPQTSTSGLLSLTLGTLDIASCPGIDDQHIPFIDKELELEPLHRFPRLRVLFLQLLYPLLRLAQ